MYVLKYFLYKTHVFALYIIHMCVHDILLCDIWLYKRFHSKAMVFYFKTIYIYILYKLMF